jgi:hypothetical protein
MEAEAREADTGAIAANTDNLKSVYHTRIDGRKRIPEHAPPFVMRSSHHAKR